MNDQELVDAWTALGPTVDQRRRIHARVAEWLDAHDTSLAAEWVGLVKTKPIAAFVLATAGALSVFAAPPFIWFARAFL